MRLSLQGTVHVALPPAEALSLFTPQGECEWVPDWNPTFPGGEATDEPGTTFVTQHRGSPTLWVIADRTESSMRYARVQAGDPCRHGRGPLRAGRDGDGDARRRHV